MCVVLAVCVYTHTQHVYKVEFFKLYYINLSRLCTKTFVFVCRRKTAYDFDETLKAFFCNSYNLPWDIPNFLSDRMESCFQNLEGFFGTF